MMRNLKLLIYSFPSRSLCCCCCYLLVLIISGFSSSGKIIIKTNTCLQSLPKNLQIMNNETNNNNENHDSKINNGSGFNENATYAFIIFGASGDLAKKKIYPAIWTLYKEQLLPKNVIIVGYGRTRLTVPDIQSRCKPSIKLEKEENDLFESFWKLNYYFAGEYNVTTDYEALDKQLRGLNKVSIENRIFYLALPPSIFQVATTSIKHKCSSQSGFTRIIIEKPFGKDSESSKVLSSHLESLFKEEQVYRIDHYLGKELVQNLMVMRFGNKIFTPCWNRDCIASVRITFKEVIGTEGRPYFEEYGIIRDVMQNHLMQVLSLFAMEKPSTMTQDDIHNEKVKVLKCIQPIKLEDVLLGRYVEPDPNKSISNSSLTPTYTIAVLKIRNERWSGVPFILKCGKGLGERKAEVRVQFHDVPDDMFNGQLKRNELVIRLQPDEAIYTKLMLKKPGLNFDVEETELDLTYKCRYQNIKVPDAYERLLLDVFYGSQTHFVRSDELAEAWRIFTPVLKEIEQKSIKPILYKFGSRGPEQCDEFISKYNFKYYGSYKWKPPHSCCTE